MVTCKLYGGLGNQLFMMAAAIGYAAKHNMPYGIPLKVENPHYEGQKPYIFPGVQYLQQDLPADFPVFTEQRFSYQEIPYMPDICLDGFWQSEKYFSHCWDKILQAFGFHYQRNAGVVAIHVRRGDYLKLQHYHHVQSLEYIKLSVYHFYPDYKRFMVFSDDMPWCKQHINETLIPGPSFEYSNGKSEIEDLTMASYCEHLIGSASTFSVWVHILNQNPDKECIFPATWFGPEGPKDTQDIYPEKSIKL